MDSQKSANDSGAMKHLSRGVNFSSRAARGEALLFKRRSDLPDQGPPFLFDAREADLSFQLPGPGRARAVIGQCKASLKLRPRQTIGMSLEYLLDGIAVVDVLHGTAIFRAAGQSTGKTERLTGL